MRNSHIFLWAFLALLHLHLAFGDMTFFDDNLCNHQCLSLKAGACLKATLRMAGDRQIYQSLNYSRFSTPYPGFYQYGISFNLDSECNQYGTEIQAFMGEYCTPIVGVSESCNFNLMSVGETN